MVVAGPRRRNCNGRRREIGSEDRAIAVPMDVTSAEQVEAAFAAAALAFGVSTSSSTMPVCRSRSRCWRRPSTTGICSTT